MIAATVLGFSMAASGTAFAEASGAGCGAGTVLFKGQSGILPQTLAATTNGSLANNLFGISSGTLGCEQDGIVQKEHERAIYAEVNFDNIKHDIAVGGGEYLNALATLSDVAPADRERFSAFTRSHFDRLVSGPETSSAAFLVALDNELAAHGPLVE
ncbi:MAG: DUF3015 family protein [Leptospirillia bacterium]